VNKTYVCFAFNSDFRMHAHICRNLGKCGGVDKEKFFTQTKTLFPSCAQP